MNPLQQSFITDLGYDCDATLQAFNSPSFNTQIVDYKRPSPPKIAEVPKQQPKIINVALYNVSLENWILIEHRGQGMSNMQRDTLIKKIAKVVAPQEKYANFLFSFKFPLNNLDLLWINLTKHFDRQAQQKKIIAFGIGTCKLLTGSQFDENQFGKWHTMHKSIDLANNQFYAIDSTAKMQRDIAVKRQVWEHLKAIL